MGHEASGTVSQVGSAVTRLRPGDRVAIEPGFPCRRCKLCKTGRYNLCPQMKFAADPPETHGALCRVFKIPEDFAYKIPDPLSLQEATLAEPLSVAVHGVRLAGIQPRQSVLVQGSGTIGLLAASVAKAYGASVVCLADINQTKLDFAADFIPGCAVFKSDPSASPQDEAERLKRTLGLEDGADVVLECSGVQSSAQTGLYASARGATYVQIGLGKHDQTLPLGFMCEREVVVKTSFRYGPGDYEIALEMLGDGKVDAKKMISSIVDFEQAAEAWERTRRGEGIKNLIRVQGG